jgi:5'-deoxynucleotidase YfbR-like HD superfamily hydrolase
MYFNSLDLFLDGSQVSRFHTVPMTQRETVGHHSSIVAGLLLLIWPDEVSVPLLQHAIFHDTAEVVTGDLPSPAKRLMDRAKLDEFEASVYLTAGLRLDELSNRDKLKLKVADILAGIYACVHEINMGNQYPIVALTNFCSYYDKLAFEHATALDWSKVHPTYKRILSRMSQHLNWRPK